MGPRGRSNVKELVKPPWQRPINGVETLARPQRKMSKENMSRNVPSYIRFYRATFLTMFVPFSVK